MSSNVQTITCPHCLTDVKQGANVCVGCKAEIRYGLSIPAFFGYYILTVIVLITALSGIVYLIKNYSHYVGISTEKLQHFVANNIDTSDNVIYYLLGFTVVVYGFIYFKYIRKAYKNHVSFERKVKQ